LVALSLPGGQKDQREAVALSPPPFVFSCSYREKGKGGDRGEGDFLFGSPSLPPHFAPPAARHGQDEDGAIDRFTLSFAFFLFPPSPTLEIEVRGEKE